MCGRSLSVLWPKNQQSSCRNGWDLRVVVLCHILSFSFLNLSQHCLFPHTLWPPTTVSPTPPLSSNLCFPIIKHQPYFSFFYLQFFLVNCLFVLSLMISPTICFVKKLATHISSDAHYDKQHWVSRCLLISNIVKWTPKSYPIVLDLHVPGTFALPIFLFLHLLVLFVSHFLWLCGFIWFWFFTSYWIQGFIYIGHFLCSDKLSCIPLSPKFSDSIRILVSLKSNFAENCRNFYRSLIKVSLISLSSAISFL